MTRTTGSLHEDQNTFYIVSRSFLLRIRNVSEAVVEKIKTHYKFNNLFSENRVFYGMTWKQFVELNRPQMRIWRMRIAYRIHTATNTLSE